MSLRGSEKVASTQDHVGLPPCSLQHSQLRRRTHSPASHVDRAQNVPSVFWGEGADPTVTCCGMRRCWGSPRSPRHARAP